MIQLKLRTEYSFRSAYGPIEHVCNKLKQTGCTHAAITDRNSTYGHIQWSRVCKSNGIKPIFGVELGFTDDVTSKERKQNHFYLSLLARSNAGLREIYAAVEEATTNFYRVPRLPIAKLQDFSQDVIILSGNAGIGQFNHLLPTHVFIESHPATNSLMRKGFNGIGLNVAVSDNFMISPDNRDVYEIMMGRNAFNRPSPMHILSLEEMKYHCNQNDFDMAETLAWECDAAIEPATNIKAVGNDSLLDFCIEGAKQRGVLLAGEYETRLRHELSLIESKGFVDYFLVIADMVKYAKSEMLVGPARGSSCGSLVCYLLGITDIDPLPHGLIFERFIDVTRNDLPDIDIDFQDDKREMVFQYLADKYGNEKVARLGTVSQYKARSAINTTAKALQIPNAEAEEIANLIIVRNDGDNRSDHCILDTFTDTDVGKAFIARYPAMMVAAKMEAHANYSGKHAAGVIVTNEPINHYVARDAKNGTVQVDKYDAEKINLMKIDLLGLRTLTIISDCLDRIGWDYARLLAHPLDDDGAFEVLRKRLFCGIFQFEGGALQNLTRNVKVDRFTDLVALTALARPGALISGAAYEWCARRNGKPVELLHPIMESITRETYGLIVFQEQMMRIVREVGGLSWEDVTLFRRGINKKLGLEYFDATFWGKFKDGALAQGIEENVARKIWETVSGAGDYVFNKSHSVAYAMVSYFTCILKHHFPLEFAVATLKNIADPQHIKQYLRELDRAGYAFKTYDKELSEHNWEVKGNVIVGGLTNVIGIGDKMANLIISRREQGIPLTEAQSKKLEDGKTPYDDVFESRSKYKDFLTNPAKYGVISRLYNIVDLPDEEDNYVFIAKIVKWKIRSLNELKFLMERNGQKVTNDKWLTMQLEDDSDMIPATVSRMNFNRFGLPLTKRSDSDWYLFRGSIQKGNRRVYIEKWKAL